MSEMAMQVWLDAMPGPAQTVVVPHVQTDHDTHLSYRMWLVKTGRSGSSRIAQSGTIHAVAGQPQGFTTLSVGVQQGDRCEIEIEMLERGVPRGRYRFSCPR